MKRVILLIIATAFAHFVHAQQMESSELEQFKEALSNVVSKIDATIKENEERLKDALKKMEDALFVVKQVEERIEKMEGSIPEVLAVKEFLQEGAKRLSELENTLRSIGEQVSLQNKEIEDLKNQVSSLAEGQNDLKNQVSSLAKRQNEHIKKAGLWQKGALAVSALACIVAIAK
jgi:chromosome segregation ATPase